MSRNPKIERNENRPRQLKADTREWSGGRVKLAVIGWEGKPDRNYIILEKNFFGNVSYPDQKFNLRFRDWVNLKRLIEGELSTYTEWEKTVLVADQESLSALISNNPDTFEKLLSNPNILKLSEGSLESLDRLTLKLYDIKKDRIDLILDRISQADPADLIKFSTLLNDLRLSQISMMASLIYQKLKIIDILEKIVSDPERLERDVHGILEQNPWILGRSYEIVQSDKPLTEYLKTNLKDDPETGKRPDLIIKVVPYREDIVIVELKAPGVKLKAMHIGQVLEYKALIERNKPNLNSIKCFIFGYEKDTTFTKSSDVEIKTFSEIISELKTEYKEYQKVLEIGKECEDEDIDF